MDKREIMGDWNIEKVERKDGEFRRENGTILKYKQYWVHFTNGDNPLVFRAKVEKVFNDYVENNTNE